MRSLILGIVLNTCIQSWSFPGLQIVECLAKSENGKKVRRKRGPERGGNSLSPPKEIGRRLETSRFETNSSSDELHQNFFHFQYSLRVNKKNILGEYSSFFRSSTWNYLQLDRVNLYRNDRKPPYPNPLAAFLVRIFLRRLHNLKAWNGLIQSG